MVSTSLRSFFVLLLVPTAAVAAIACSSTTDGTAATPAAPRCSVVDADGGPACGQNVNLCTSADATSCWFTVGADRIDCASCSDSDLDACNVKMNLACPRAVKCAASTTTCPGTTTQSCSNEADTCYFLVGTTRVDCASCASADQTACSAQAKAVCGDAGASQPGE